MVWVVSVEIAGQRQLDSFLLTSGQSGSRREITVGRPPSKSDAKPDIIVAERSVSKVHALLCVEAEDGDEELPCRLAIKDKSRFGTSVNGQKIPAGESLELSAGDVVQLAPKTFLIIEAQPLDVAVRPDHPRLGDVREAAHRAGARVTHVFGDPASTRVLYAAGEPVWSAPVHGAVRGASFVSLEWLQLVAAAGLMVGSLPEGPRVDELLLLGPAQLPVRVTLPPREAGTRDLLRGFTFGFSHEWRDEGLAALLTDLGGRVLDSSAQGSGRGTAPVVALYSQGGSGSGNHHQHHHGLSVEQLLMRILTADAAAVRQDLSAAAAEPGVAAEPADSDETQAAEEEEGDGEGEVAQPHAGAPKVGQTQTQPATAARPVRDSQAGLPSAAQRTEGPAASQAPAEADGWMVVARRPEDGHTGAAYGEAPTPQDAATTTHEDAPRPKRQRTDAGGPTQPASTAAPLAPTAVPNTISRKLAATSLSDPPGSTRAPVAPPPGQENVPWMTQHPHGRAAAARRSGIGMHAPSPSNPGPSTAAANTTVVAVKEEPAAARPFSTAAGRTRGKATAAAATAATNDPMESKAPAARVKEEQVPEVPDASAQVVLEVDLFAPTPDQAASRIRHGSAEPLDGPAASGGGGGGAGASSPGGAAVGSGSEPGGGWLDTQQGAQRDFKQFRKQGAQLPAVTVPPLPVFLVDNFHNSEEVEAFMRQEEERASKKRRADEMFKTAGAAAKKPSRPARR